MEAVASSEWGDWEWERWLSWRGFAIAGLLGGSALGIALLLRPLKGMGQGGSHGGCVVEVAPAAEAAWRPRRSRAEAKANAELDSCAEPDEPWRITINPLPPTTNAGGAQISTSTTTSPTSPTTADWSANDPSVQRRRSYRIKSIRTAKEGRESSPPARGFSSGEFRERLRQTADGLYGCQKLLSLEEARALTLLLESREEDYLLKTLTILSNLAAFAANQDLVRETGALDHLLAMLGEEGLSEPLRIMLVQALANLAINSSNQGLLQAAIPALARKVAAAQTSQLEKLVAVQALGNLTLELSDPSLFAHLATTLPTLLRLLQRPGGSPPLGALRLLINLSCTPQLCLAILATNVEGDVWHCLLADDAGLLVRGLTLYARLAESVLSLGVAETSSVGRALPSPQIQARLARLLGHADAEVRSRAAASLRLARSLPRLPSPSPAS